MTMPSTEQELSDARAFLERLLAASPALIVKVEPRDLSVTYVSPNVTQVVGYASEEVVGVRNFITDHIHPDDLETFLTQIAEAVAARAAQTELEYRFLHKDGRYRWFYTLGRADYDAAGAPLGFYAYIVDLTARKQAEEALRRSEERQELILRSMPIVLGTMTAADFTTTWVSANVERVVGFSPADFVGNTTFWPSRIHAEDQARVLNAFEVIRSTGIVDIEYRWQCADGAYRWFLHHAVLLGDQEGQPRQIVETWLDITERKQFEEALAHLRDEAERANKTKSEFLSRVSHELRTPLNATLGFAQLLAMDDLTPDQRESVSHILRAGRHLLNLINEVLDISRLDAGRTAISPETVSVTEVAREALDIVAPLAADRNIQVESDLGDPDGHYVLADRQRLKQIMLNLLSNAVKYNRVGGRVAITDVEKDNRVRILITDTGQGIPTESMHRLFTPFERLDAGEGGVEGTGLGLALSKRLAEVMEGTLGAESTPGVGSTFWVELPRAQAPAQLDQGDEAGDDSARAPGPPIACTVLHIEDNPSNHRLVERVLARRPGVKLLAAMQGRMGLDLARRHRPDLILLDLQLPDIPGEQILERLQADPETRRIPVVVVSADATPGQTKKLLDRGAREYLTKPIDIAKLIEVVDTVPVARAQR